MPLHHSLIPALLMGLFVISSQAHPPGHGHGDAPALRGVHSLDVAAQGESLHLLAGDYDGQHAAPKLQYLRSDDGGETWSKPVQVDAGLPHAHAAHRGMDPQIAASGDQLIAVWMTPGTDHFGGGPMATALSHDGGKTWQPGPNPADDGSTEGHGFMDITSDSKGNFHLVWLDSRHDLRGLRYSRSGDGGKSWAANQTLDAETCECCWNHVVSAPDGRIAVLYRDKNPRDMRVVASSDHGLTWNAAQPIGDFQWQFEGCPHVGGALALQGDHWHATVWTGSQTQSGVYHAASVDAGKNWQTDALPVSASGTHPSLAVDGDGRVLMAWTTLTENGPVIQTRLSSDRGKTWGKPVQQSLSGTSASHPLALNIKEGFRVFWTEQGAHQPSVWRMISLP